MSTVSCDDSLLASQGDDMEHPRPAVHRTIVVVDVEGFGDRHRTNADQIAVRAGLYQALRRAFTDAGVSWDSCDREDRGDGVFILVPAETPKAPFVDAVPDALVAALREHNTTRPAQARIRLRMALHAGEVTYDEHGVTATAVNLAFRLLDASPVKAALAQSPGVLVVATSEWFFDEVVRHSTVTDSATYRQVRVVVKETSTVGWIALPDHPYPSDAAQMTALLVDEPPAGALPRQLPAPPRSFTGRDDELAVLDKAATQGGAVVISAIGGAGGIGKTWLALRWAQEHLEWFPDGQLFVDLRGFSPDGEPMSPAVAVRGFLDALGVKPERIPVDPHAQAGLFRSLVADKRMLVVLDNAADTAQVTPLLPGTPTCTVLVTSRNQLSGLVIGHGAHHLALDALTDAEAHALLTARLGAERLAAEPAMARELVRLCSGLPLALSILAGRARPGLPLAMLVDELHEAGLSAWDDADPTASLLTVFSWSYRALTAEQARVFALLGVAPGPDIGLAAAADLTGLPHPRARTVLRELEQASLLDRDASGRYRMHDLIRQFAAEHAQHADRDAALRRTIDFYLHTAYAGDRLLDPHRAPIRLDPPAPGCRPHSLPDDKAALTWFDTEHTCLLAAQRAAVTRGLHHQVWHLAWALNTFHHRHGHRHDRLAVWQAGLAAANHLDDAAAKIVAYRYLGYACTRVGRDDEALEHLHRALTLAEHTGDRHGQARTHQAFAWAWERRGNHQRALAHATQALDLYRGLDNPVREADTLNAGGWYAARLGHYDQAREHCDAALALHRRHHNREGEANALDSLGYIDHHTAHHADAIRHYQRALALYRDLGNVYEEASTLDRLGHPYAALGHDEQARAVWQQALDLFRVQHRAEDADRVQEQLDDLDQVRG